MNIITELDDVLLSEKAVIVLSKFKDFVRTRLKVLQEEIDKEGGNIVIRINASGIEYQNFSEGLVERMASCITAEDLMYASSKIMLEEES